MTSPSSPLADIPNLLRCETTPREAALAKAAEMTHAVYPHDAVYGQFCTVQDYIDCPPEDVFDYLSDLRNLDEWTYSTRHFEPVPGATDGLHVGWDTLADDTRIYAKVVAHRESLSVDYHCAWDQGDELWMIYINRIIPAELVLKKPGSVLVWTNCRHPYYDDNPNKHLVADPNRVWVGDMWPLFYAGHRAELDNLKTILEYRHSRGIPVTGHVVREGVSA
ncbi:SRPBCC family protein [Micromonospora echinospora]|uniref:SRPBCC family protein n=1 Tax=Micromonospora echinospora TaxID=1877 RepID=UPI003A8A1EE4